MCAVRSAVRFALGALALGSAAVRGDEERALSPQSGAAAPGTFTWPHVVPLQREQVPVVRNGVTVSYKTSYSGGIRLGSDGQEFRVVFDTGSGHLVLPSSECTSETCFKHRRYNISTSSTSVAINVDGLPVPADELCDQVTIGYGTGLITGEFAHETVCFGDGRSSGEEASGPCVTASIVMAVEMSAQPFNSFKFDGIFGLALDALAMTSEFSIFNRLDAQAPSAHPSFGVYLSDDGSQGSEIALGGHNPARALTPLAWAPVQNPKLGYWQVRIKAVKVNGVTLDICEDGSCRGVMDTGTSHIGVPSSRLGDLTRMLSAPAGDSTDCRGVESHDIEFELEGVALKLKPANYMRTLPLQAGTDAGSNMLAQDSRLPVPGSNSELVPASAGTDGAAASGSKGTCTPRLMPVNLPEPLGPNLFILGEPVMNRYYTVYNWKEKQIGFGLAENEQNRKEIGGGDGGDEVFMMQITLNIQLRTGRKRVDSGAPKLRIL